MSLEEFPFTFACRRSGNCCARPDGHVRVGPQEAVAIAADRGLDLAAFESRYLDGDKLKQGLGGRCVFLQDGAQAACSIYEVRPERCRSWPFWPELRDDPVARAEAMRLCPGITPRPSNAG